MPRKRDPLKGKVAVVGIGEVPTGRHPERPVLGAALEACRQAILDAGIKKDDVDTIIPTGAVGSRRHNADLIFGVLVEELGLLRKAHDNLQVMSGGSSGTSMLRTAAGLVLGGMARTVLCVHSDQFSRLSLQEVIDLFSTLGQSEEWESPYGHCMNAVAGLIAQRYMYETGTTEEEMASVCVALRKWAELNPNAMFRKPTSIEEILASKMVASPLRARECNVLGDGSAAFIVTSAERARELTKTPVYVLGTGGCFTHYTVSQEADMARLGFPQAAKEAYAQAGLRPGDVQIAELYDAYPVFALIALEGLGLCPRGEGGRFVRAGNTWPGGKLPMNTNGGLLSQGHTGAGGGFALLVEACRQLMSKAGARQVPNAKIAAETSSGGTWMDSHVTLLGTEVP